MYKTLELGLWAGEPGTNLLDTGAPFYNTYRTADNKFISVGALEGKFYDQLIKGKANSVLLTSVFLSSVLYQTSNTSVHFIWTKLVLLQSSASYLNQLQSHNHLDHREVIIKVCWIQSTHLLDGHPQDQP